MRLVSKPSKSCILSNHYLTNYVCGTCLRGYAFKPDIDLIQKLFVKARRWGIVNKDYNLEELLDNCDKALFVASQSSKHCLYSHFSKDNQLHIMVLRCRGHNFALPIINTKCTSNTFINLTLFKYV